MSTLKVNTIQDASGGNSSTAEQIAVGRAKAWVNFNGFFATSPFTEANGGIRNSFNVSSVTDNGTGDYTVTFSNAMPNANYLITASAKEFDSTQTTSVVIMPGRNLTIANSITTTFVRVISTNGGSNFDSVIVHVVIFGD